ncbi:MAG: lipase family protein [Rhodococcus sp. (in: high G+C Gram-positive bacteria)]
MKGKQLALAAVLAAVATTTTPVTAMADSGPIPRIVSAEIATTGPVVHVNAERTALIRYSSRAADGSPADMTGSVLFPRVAPPTDGWPIAVLSHMTVGSADRCAPSTMQAGHPELVRAHSLDAVAARMLDAGFVVVRPDFEGIGTPGPHPYLMGRPLARSVIDAARASTGLDDRIGRDVALVGHSEGAVASLFAAAADTSDWGPLRLRSVAAVTPPTEMRRILELATPVTVAGPGIGDTVALAALLIGGASTVDPEFAEAVRSGGLSERAAALLPDIETKCFGELASADSFGGLAPSMLLGPEGARVAAMLGTVADDNDVRHLRIDPAVPIRLDAGLFDPVAPAPLIAGLAEKYRSAGSDVTYAVQPGARTPVPSLPAAADEIAQWSIQRVR